MKSLLLAALTMAALSDPRLAAAACPNPIPQNPSGEEYVACLAAFQDQIAELQLERAFAALPSGAVLAFNLEECPSGWTPFREAEGRFVVGVGNDNGRNKDPSGNSLTARHLAQTGGFEAHKLTPDEMPSHTHEHSIAKRVKRQNGDHGSAEIPGTTSTTKAAGGGKPHNNVPPFVALRYCQRGAPSR